MSRREEDKGRWKDDGKGRRTRKNRTSKSCSIEVDLRKDWSIEYRIYWFVSSKGSSLQFQYCSSSSIDCKIVVDISSSVESKRSTVQSNTPTVDKKWIPSDLGSGGNLYINRGEEKRRGEERRRETTKYKQTIVDICLRGEERK